MISRDYLIKAMDDNDQIRMIVAHTTGAVEEAHQRHGTSATASAALGRVLTAALMMGSDLKGANDSLTIRVNGNGPAGPVLASVNSQGRVRALISNPQADLPSKSPGKLAVGDLVGTDGFLEVIKDMGLKQPFIGKVPLVSGEIGEDVANYFLRSEQIPSLVSLGVLVGPDLSIQAAGGLFVQAMPGADDELLEQVEKQVMALGPISHLLYGSDSLEEILDKSMLGIPYHVVGEQDVEFRCNCSYERLANIMASLTPEELKDIQEETGRLEVSCNFCNETYQFQLEDIEGLQKTKALE